MAIAVAAAVVFVGTAGLAPPRYEPIGPAAVPRVMGGILVLLSVLLIFDVLRRPTNADTEQNEDVRHATPLVPILSAGAIILYVAVMDSGWLGFRPATALLVFGLAFGLTGFRRRAALPAAVFAILLSLGTFFVFTEFFYIDLPR